MPLPDSEQNREHLHTRTIRVDAFAREDGQWDLEAELVDVKGYDFPKHGGVIHKAGQPVHHMHLRVTFNEEFTVTAAQAAYDAAPYNEYCYSIAPDYGDLVGMNLLRGFRHAVKARFGRTAGCTHMTEMSYVLPTVAVQTMAGRRRKEKSPEAQKKKPFQLGGCHALRLDSPMTKKFHPEWYIEPEKGSDS
ncbi:MAG: hypothetical protein CML16_09930 [Pusillimonas sp.]|jgi:hypothetical protein|nr:hypothetical protein [Pusillimonas sp.]|tara:strand:- start:250164 stop:250736 length:573 start_codon:yes stop_codon:yes gene_type:complete